MNWADPRGFWLLLGIPLLLILYFRRGVRRERVVASLFLWKRIASSPSFLQSSSKSKLPPSFFFWALTILAGSLALARPFVEIKGPLQLRVLLENSARIGTVMKDGRTRLDHLRGKVLDRLAEADFSAQIRLEVFPGGPELTGSLSEIRGELEKLLPTESPCRLEEEIEKRVFSSTSNHETIWLLTDRIPKNLPPLVHVSAIGEASRNVGFVAYDCPSIDNTSEYYSGEAVIKNFSNESRQLVVQQFIDGKPDFSFPTFLIAGGESKSIAWGTHPNGWKTFELRIETEDELAADNRLFFVFSGLEFRVLASVDSPPSIRRALSSIPGVNLQEWTGDLSEDFNADLIIGRGSTYEEIPSVIFETDGESFRPASVRTVSESFLGRLLSFEGVKISVVHRLSDRGGMPLALAKDGQGNDSTVMSLEGNSVRIGFDLSRTNWDRHPSFPVFWAAWIEHLREKQGGFGFVRTGQPLPEEGGSIAWKTGWIQGKDGKTYAANLLDPGQSDNSGETGEAGPELKFSSSGKQIRSLENYLILSAILCFLLGWFLESRGR